MNTYTLHLPPDAAPGRPEALDRAVLVKDGFAWGAFFFTFLWFFYHRLWLAGLGVLVGLVGLGILFQVLDVSRPAATLAQILVHVLIGLEANSLRRWRLERRGQPAVDLVTGRNSEEAAVKAFGRWLAAAAEPQRAPGRSAVGPGVPIRSGSPPPVIGLFPDPEIRR